MVTNQLFEECEEVSTKNESELVNDMVASRQQSDFMYSSHPEAQGELQIDSCNSLNEIEYQDFVFPVKGIHDSVNSDQF